MNPLATDPAVLAAAAFDLYAEQGMLKWDAFATVVRGCGFDPTEAQVAEMWAKTKETTSDGATITFSQLCAGLRSAPGLADVNPALATVVGPQRLTAAEAKTLLTTMGDEPLSEAEWSEFEALFFPDGAARSASDLGMAFRDEDPARSSKPVHVQSRAWSVFAEQ